jgi:hypothetical protein
VPQRIDLSQRKLRKSHRAFVFVKDLDHGNVSSSRTAPFARSNH